MMHKLSIIIPVYNAEKFLSRCIDSILSQSFTDYELLLIDDGSKDESGAICDEYAAKDDRIRVFHKENGGVSSARNLGLDEAQGEWVTFIDADDFVEENFFPAEWIDDVSLYVQNWKFMEGGYSGYEEHVPSGKVCAGDDYHQFLKSYSHYDLFRTPWGKFFKMDLIRKHSICFDRKYRIGEDTLFVMEYESVCTSLDVLGTSVYRYWRESENWAGRYQLSEQEVADYFSGFMVCYEKLPVKLPLLASKIVSVFGRLLTNPSKLWKYSPELLRIQSEYISNKSIQHKIRHFCKIVVSKFLSIINHLCLNCQS